MPCLGTLGKAKAHARRKLSEWWDSHQLTAKYRRLKRLLVSRRSRQAAYLVEEPRLAQLPQLVSRGSHHAVYLVEEAGWPQLGRVNLGMEELAEEQGGQRMEVRQAINNERDGKIVNVKFSIVLPFDELHRGDHETEGGNCSSTNLQNPPANLPEQEDRNTMVEKDQDESQSADGHVTSHAVIMVKAADDAVMNY